MMLPLFDKLLFLVSDLYVAPSPPPSRTVPILLQQESLFANLPEPPHPSKKKKKLCATSAEEVAHLAGGLDKHEKKELLRTLRRQLRAQESQSEKDGQNLRKVLQSSNASRSPLRGTSKRKRRPSSKKQGTFACSIHPDDAISIAPVTEHTILDQLSTLPERFIDLRQAYLWFWTISSFLANEQRADDAKLLTQSCRPLELVFLLSQGWLSPDACTAWKEARYTLGKGLLELARMELTQFHFTPISSRPSADEVNAYINQWKRGRPPLDADIPRYDWENDAKDRTYRGPFGPALLPYGDVKTLEHVLKLCSDPDAYVHTGCFPGFLGVLLAPLMRCRRLSGTEPQEKVDIGMKRRRAFDDADEASSSSRNVQE